MRQVMLTTSDNPFDPFTQYDDWFAFDSSRGHHTPGYLARIAVFSTEMSEADQEFAIEQAIDEIVEENLNGLMRKVVREVPDEIQV